MCIKEGDEWKMAFTTHAGLFEPVVMFFGMTNSSAVMLELKIPSKWQYKKTYGRIPTKWDAL